MTAKPSQSEGGSTAKILRNIEAPTNGQVGACSGTCCTAHSKCLSLRCGDRFPKWHGSAVKSRLHFSPGETEDSRRAESKRRAGERNFKACCRGQVPYGLVGQIERAVIHRPGWRNSYGPMPEAARKILHGCLSASLEDIDCEGRNGEVAEQSRAHLASSEARILQDATKIKLIGLDAVEAGIRQGRIQLADGGLAVRRGGDDFGKKRIVEWCHLRARGHPGIHAHAGREVHLGEQSRAGLEIFEGIFGVEARLDGMSRRLSKLENPVFGEGSGSLANHPLDEVDAENLLGDSMLDLQACIDLQKVKLVFRSVEKKLHRAG